MLSLLSLLTLLLPIGCLAQTSTSSVVVTLPTAAPSSSRPLSKNLLSFSIEQDRWPDWSGIDSRNEFTYNALSRLGSLTGSPPKIRVGGDSEDHTIWDPTVTINVDEFPPPNTITPYPEATRIAVGNDFYELSKFLPAGTHMTWGVNLGLDNATNAFNMARAILGAFSTPAVKASGVILDLIEIGNEPDIYFYTGLRGENYTINDYVTQWINVSTPVAQEIHGPVHIQACSFVSQSFTPTEVFNLGLLDSTPGKLVSVVAQHVYSGAFCDGGDFSLASFMSKSAVRGNLSIFEADIAETNKRGLSYILGETGSFGCHGAPGLSNTAGAALWVIDYTLFAATIGISELHFHEGIGFNYNFIQPVALNRSTIDGSPLDPPLPPHIQPSFYAALVVNTLISTNTLSLRVVELNVSDDNVSGYAAYEGGILKRALFVNLDAWLSSQEATGEARPAVHIDFSANFLTSLPSQATMQVRRLVVNHADDLANLTWAGQSYEETSDVSPTGKEVVDVVAVSQGLDIRSSEAVLVSFN